MKKLSNTEVELKKSVAYKKKPCTSPLRWYVVEKAQSLYSISLDLLRRLSIRAAIIPNKFEFEDEFEYFSKNLELTLDRVMKII